jgi:hypothetical protein
MSGIGKPRGATQNLLIMPFPDGQAGTAETVALDKQASQ